MTIEVTNCLTMQVTIQITNYQTIHN